ncbi:beta-Ig-H3 fasciclin [Micractinium conductrix]|uniref:Beta-Ig-H3 fasciclin n=1 Tax=Micractinium conductrix TaxID=554055 RepID=A0A2P6VQ90_9CHLO|nr:beta-Ig-H3 fasciclin [Micractinium conductrix]|eukprot:PSC76241.1 beta-Ig-H3 fasciclin [Micractinium conductrix]
MMRAVLMVALLALAGSASAKTPKSVAELVVSNPGGDFTILLAAIKAADPSILAALSDPKLAATVFAPTDKAFKRLLKALNVSAEDLLKDKDLLTAVLSYHVIGTPVPSSALKIRQWVQTLLKGKTGVVKITDKFSKKYHEQEVRVYTTSGSNAKVILPDIVAGKSVVHVINRVLIPGKEYFAKGPK